MMKYIAGLTAAILGLVFLGIAHIAQAETVTYTGNSNISGSNAAALAAWKAEFDGFKIRRETFEAKKLDPLKIPLGCYDTNCYPPAVDGFTKGGLVWSSPGKAMRLVHGNVTQGKYAMRVFDNLKSDYTVSVKSLKQLAYGICLDLDTNGGNNNVSISLDGNEVASFPLNANGKFLYPVHRFCVIDTMGFRTVSVVREDPNGTPQSYHPSIFSTDNVYFVRSAAVPAFGDLVGYPAASQPEQPPVDSGDCPAGQEVVYEDDGPHCEDI